MFLELKNEWKLKMLGPLREADRIYFMSLDQFRYCSDFSPSTQYTHHDGLLDTKNNTLPSMHGMLRVYH